jgi:hypothetical protein
LPTHFVANPDSSGADESNGNENANEVALDGICGQSGSEVHEKESKTV